MIPHQLQIEMFIPDMTPHYTAPKYKATSIRECDAARVFPLIQAMRSDVSLEAWLAFTAALSQQHENPKHGDSRHGDASSSEKITWPSRGILAIESSRGYFHGLFSYYVGCTIDHHAVLEVSNFIALDALDRAAAIKALIAVLEDLARALHCTAIHTQVSSDWRVSRNGPDGEQAPSQLQDHFQTAGHTPKYLNLYKPLRSDA